MFRNKTFMSGLGIGLVVATLAMQIIFSVNQMEHKTAVNSEQAIDLETVKQYAQNNGYRLVAKEEKLFTSEQMEMEKKKISDEYDKKIDAIKSQNKQTETETGSAKKGIYIKQGLDASEVSARLKEFGIIKDEDKFIESLSQQRLNGKIQFGYYEFPANPGLQEVIKEITTFRQ